MNEYLNQELATLVDMLAAKTETYSHMMSVGYSDAEKFAQLAEEILLIQRAILKKMGVAENSDDPP